MWHIDDRRPMEKRRRKRPERARARKVRISVEGLEERSLLSGAALRASIIEARERFLAWRAHGLEIRAEILAHRHGGPGATTVHAPAIAAAARTVQPAAASASLQVQWTYPGSGTDLTGDRTVGFLAVGFSDPIDLSTLNGNNVQLSYQAFGSSTWIRVPVSLGYSAGNRAVVVTPGMFTPDGIHVQPDGTYVLGVFPGLKSTPSTGSKTLTGNFYMGYTDHSTWGLPGHYPITAASLPGNAPTIPNDPYRPNVISDAPGSGVLIIDQYEQLDFRSVNKNNLKLFHLKGDGTLGASVPIKVTYDAEVPSIYMVPLVALTKGNYRFEENNTVSFSGNRMTNPVFLDFFVPNDEQPAWNNTSGPVDVLSTFPANGGSVSVTDLASIVFSEPVDVSTLNSNTIRLQKNVNGNWVSVPIAITYNAGTFVAFVTPTMGIKSQGTQVRLVVNADPSNNPIRGTNQLSQPNVMAQTRISTYTFNSPSGQPLIDAPHWGSFPAPGSVIRDYPAALVVMLAKFNGYQPGSITNQTFQLFAADSNGRPFGGPINGNRIQIAWDPRSGSAVITLPDVRLGDGRYVLFGRAANGVPGVGVVDIAGNVQKLAFRPGPFTITGTGRPQTVG